jgi:hypothetical protein
MALAKLWDFVAEQIAWYFPRPTKAGPPSVDGYNLDYSQPSERALASVDHEMKAYIARSQIVSVEGEL